MIAEQIRLRLIVMNIGTVSVELSSSRRMVRQALNDRSWPAEVSATTQLKSAPKVGIVHCLASLNASAAGLSDGFRARVPDPVQRAFDQLNVKMPQSEEVNFDPLDATDDAAVKAFVRAIFARQKPTAALTHDINSADAGALCSRLAPCQQLARGEGVQGSGAGHPFRQAVRRRRQVSGS